MMDNSQQYETYELVMKDNEDEVFALSLVSNPAIQSNFVYFSADGKKELVKFATTDEDQRTIVGPILIPDMKILRLKEDGVTPYYVIFSKETVKALAQKYIKDNKANNITLEHQKPTNDVSLVESWITDSAVYDKAKSYGLNVKPGTWMGVFKVDNPNVWKQVKAGDFKGISLEGIFSHELIKASMLESVLEKEITDLSDIEADLLLSHLKAIIKKDKRYGKGEKLIEESHSDYPDGVKSNAKKALKYAADNGWGSCGTPVGKLRANQLAKGEPISVDTIKRMYSFLSRHEGDLESSTAYGDGCGKLMYDAWGGKAGLGWAHNKLKELGLVEAEGAQPSVASSYPGEGPTKKKKNYIHPALIGTKN
jgi:hypothetical protein